jgi:hypothetical protein
MKIGKNDIQKDKKTIAKFRVVAYPHRLGDKMDIYVYVSVFFKLANPNGWSKNHVMKWRYLGEDGRNGALSWAQAKYLSKDYKVCDSDYRRAR